MAVRFTPAPEPKPRPNRDNLAEVIDLRARLVERSIAPEPPEPEVEKLPDPRQEAMRMLARRALSSRELSDKLQERGHAERDIAEIIDNFIESHYLDDTALARTICEKLRSTKRASIGHLRRELLKRGIPATSIEQVLSEIDDEEEDQLLWEVARDRARRLTSLDRVTAERRLFGFLARRGWSGSNVRRVTSAVLDEALGDAR